MRRLARALRRGLANLQIQAHLTAAVIQVETSKNLGEGGVI